MLTYWSLTARLRYGAYEAADKQAARPGEVGPPELLEEPGAAGAAVGVL